MKERPGIVHLKAIHRETERELFEDCQVLIYLFFVYSIQLRVSKNYRWLDSNRGSLMSEATWTASDPNY